MQKLLLEYNSLGWSKVGIANVVQNVVQLLSHVWYRYLWGQYTLIDIRMNISGRCVINRVSSFKMPYNKIKSPSHQFFLSPSS